MTTIDLTHKFTATMPVYPGDPVPELKLVSAVEQQGYSDHHLSSTMHVGTHLDAPMHMIANGKTVADLPIEKFFGPAQLLDARGEKQINAKLLEKVTIKPGMIILILTGLGQAYGQPEYFNDFPVVTEDFATALINLEVKMVGFDTPSPDRPPYAIHQLLLTKEIIIIENLTNLEQLVNIKNFIVYALPLKLEANGAPARVIAQWSN